VVEVFQELVEGSELLIVLQKLHQVLKIIEPPENLPRVLLDPVDVGDSSS